MKNSPYLDLPPRFANLNEAFQAAAKRVNHRTLALASLDGAIQTLESGGTAALALCFIEDACVHLKALS